VSLALRPTNTVSVFRSPRQTRAMALTDGKVTSEVIALPSWVDADSRGIMTLLILRWGICSARNKAASCRRASLDDA
jgi:hypothetical protein